MNKISYSLVFNRKKKLNEEGRAVIQIEAYQMKKRKHFTTKVYITPDQWDSKKRIIKKHPNKEALNRLLYAQIANLEEKELALWQAGKKVTLENLKASLSLDRNIEQDSFLPFYKKEALRSSLKESTKHNHLTTYCLLQQYKSNISFCELSYDFISSFEYYLRQRNYHINTIAKHMRHLKRYINLAINKEYMDIGKYPFRRYKIKIVDSRHTHLSPEELKLMESLTLVGLQKKLQHTLDAFLFCCYTGLRYSDFTRLTSENIIEHNGDTWLMYRSFKTDMQVRLPLFLLFEGKALCLLNKYQHNPDAFFEIKPNSSVNKELLRLAKLCGVKKRISFHTARHTNATILIYKGTNITTIQRLLGHRSIKTTQVYADVMDMTIISDLERSKGNVSG